MDVTPITPELEAQLRAEQVEHICGRDCAPYKGREVYSEYLEGERRYPVTDMWEREAGARRSHDDSEAIRDAEKAKE